MTLSEAVVKARAHQDKVGSIHNGKIIEAVIPAPKDLHLFVPFVDNFKRNMLYIKREDISFTKLNTSIQAKNFEVYYLLEGSMHTSRTIRSLTTENQMMTETI
ncbi:MAG: hypothetical protein JWN78_2451 [Bacteroidota bacterium]|nr:hypothetical protein [Bacteroidota bacterium]